MRMRIRSEDTQQTTYIVIRVILGRVLNHIGEQQDITRYPLHRPDEIRVKRVGHEAAGLEPRGKARLISDSEE